MARNASPDSRFYTEKPQKPKRQKGVTEYFYSIEPLDAPEECVQDRTMINEGSALYCALGPAAGPFCRPECIIAYHGWKKQKVKLRRVTE